MRCFKQKTIKQLLMFAASLGVVWIVGCSPNTPESKIAELNDTNIERLANLYLNYQKNNDWYGPVDEENFKTYIRGISPRKLERIDIDPADIDSIFVNERDGEPFKVRYGVKGSMMGCDKPVVFEAVGVGGKKMIGFLNMTQREVEQAEYDELWSADDAESSDTSARDQEQS